VPSRSQIALWCCLGACLASRAGAATRFVQEPQLEGCLQWEGVEQGLLDGKIEGKEARKRFKELWSQVTIDDLPPAKEGLWQWDFPVPGYGEDSYSAQIYSAEKFKYLDGPKFQGHPGVNIYIHDRERKGLDERSGKPAPVVSCTDGVVVSARKFWSDTDPNPLGVYVVILCQDEKRLFYYCNLSKLRVSLGELVDKGQVIGYVGRTGADTVRKNLGTHLRFQVFSFDDGLFYPVFPCRALREAKQLPWPLPEPEYRKLPKHLYDIDRLPGHKPAQQGPMN
jgi:murein DD-endopeptidase MepM/ murein hydrolase activator NlpD